MRKPKTAARGGAPTRKPAARTASKRGNSRYAGLADRYAALASRAEEDEEEDGEEEAAEEREEERAEEPEEERRGKKGRKAKKARSKKADEEDDDEEASEEEDDEEATEEEDDEEASAFAVAKAARTTERKRWAAVMSSPEAKGRIPLACSLLTDTNMSAGKICAALAVSPAESRQGLSARMAAVPRPDIGSAPSKKPDPQSHEAQAADIVAAYNKAVGRSSADAR